MIEPRLSGGFLAAEYDGNVASSQGIDLSKLEEARDRLLARPTGEHDPDHDHAFARFQLAQGKVERDTLIKLQRVLQQQPNNAEAHNDLGVYLVEVGRLEDALVAFAQALTHRADMPEAMFNRALCFQRLLLGDQYRVELEKLVTLERDGGWSDEAKERLSDLLRTTDETAVLKDPASSFEAAVSRNNREEAAGIVGENFESMRRYALLVLCRRHLQATVERNDTDAAKHLYTLKVLGSLFEEVKGDVQVTEIADYLTGLSPPEKAAELKMVIEYTEAVRSFELGHVAAALKQLGHLKQRFSSRRNNVFEELCSSLLAQCHYVRKDFLASTRMLKEAVARTEQRRWPYHRAKLFSQLAIGQAILGQDSLAIRLCQQALTLGQGVPDLEAKILQFVTLPYWQLGDHDTAVARLRDSTKLYLEIGPRPGRTDNLTSNFFRFAEIYGSRGNDSVALLYASQALKYSTAANNHAYSAELSSFIAACHSRLSEFPEAEGALVKAHAHLGQLENGRPREASAMVVLTNAGEVAIRRGEISRARAYYDEAEALAKRDEGKVIQETNVLRGLARAYAMSGKPQEARMKLMSAVRLIEGYRSNIESSEQRSAFLDAIQDVYDEAIMIDCEHLGLSREAFELSDRSRAQALLEQMMFADAGQSHLASPAEQVQVNSGSIKPVRADQIQAILPEDTLLLQYAVTGERTYIFAVTRGSFEVVRSEGNAASLDRMVHEYVSAIKRRAPVDEIIPSGTELYKLLIKPVAESVAVRPNICIIPDKSLHFLPYAALIDESGKYLVESKTITYAPSSRVLVRCIEVSKNKTTSRAEKILAVGNPYFDRNRFPTLQPLTEAVKEASAIAALYGARASLLTSERATESALWAEIEECDVVHMAVHCVVEEESPWQAALLLAPERATSPSDFTDGGLLYLGEIYGRILSRTRLVVLSACQSGLGRYYRGEGIVSLVRPFLANRVPTIVATLWSVESTSTSDLMLDFHKQRKLAGHSPREALRKAQLNMLDHHEYRHPYFWAPFIVVGESGLTTNS